MIPSYYSIGGVSHPPASHNQAVLHIILIGNPGLQLIILAYLM